MQFDRIETSVCSTPGRWSIGVSGGPVGHAGSSWARPGSSWDVTDYPHGGAGKGHAEIGLVLVLVLALGFGGR
ncbi:hypothetical protein CH340_00600 [Rhodoplanes serenus]|nr:hypothetical protein CH340_00600 [Rhodoplanes serenus]